MNFQPGSHFTCIGFASPLLLAAAIGCQPLPATDPAAEITAATAVSTPIRVHTDGASTDVGPDAGGQLFLSDAVRSALDNDAELQAAIARVYVALAEAKQARLLPNPVLDVALRFPEGGGKPVIEAGLTADLVALLKLPRATGASDKRLQAAARDALTAALQTVSTVQEVYFTAQSLDAEVAILQERQRLNQRLLELASDRVKIGESPRLDLLTLQAQQAEIETELIQKDAQRTDERLILARLLGQPSSDAAWQLPAWRAPEPVAGREPAWIEAALRSRPEIQSKQWELAALGDEAAISGLGFLDGAEIGAASERDGDWSVGPAASIPIPLFDMGQARRERAAAAVVVARHELMQAMRQAVEDVRRAWASLNASNRALAKVQNELLPAQRNRRDQAEVAYKNGSADITVFLLAEQDLQASRAKLIEVQRDVSLAMVRLERCVGGAGIARKFQSATTLPTTTTPIPADAQRRTNP